MPASSLTEDMTSVARRRSTILECDIRHVRLPSVLQLVEGEMLTGRITFVPGGVVAVRSGAVVGALTDTGLTGVAAMRELFLLSEGSCRLTLDPSVTGEPLGSTLGLILDGCKLLDEWNELAGSCLVFSSNATMLTPDLVASVERVQRVLDAMQSGVTLANAVSGCHRSEVVPHLIHLIEAGLVALPTSTPLSLVLPSQAGGAAEKTTPSPRPTILESDPSAIPDDVDDLVTRARSFIRANELDAAERLLRAALEKNPNDRVLAQNMRHLALRRVQQST